MRNKPSKGPSGTYVTHSHVACRACGQLTRIEVCFPLVQASTLSQAKFCPMCGVEFKREGATLEANGTGFVLVASSIFLTMSPTPEDVAIVESIYPMWDAFKYPTFKRFLRSLIPSG